MAGFLRGESIGTGNGRILWRIASMCKLTSRRTCGFLNMTISVVFWNRADEPHLAIARCPRSRGLRPEPPGAADLVGRCSDPATRLVAGAPCVRAARVVSVAFRDDGRERLATHFAAGVSAGTRVLCVRPGD